MAVSWRASKNKGRERKGKDHKTESHFGKLQQEYSSHGIWKQYKAEVRENDLIQTQMFMKDLKKRELVAELFKWVLVISEIVLTGKEGMREIKKNGRKC